MPNLTEASFMLREEYRESYDEEYIRSLLKRLTGLGAKRAALTGIGFRPDEIGFYMYDSTTDTYSHSYNEKLPVAYHGTGDVFTSSFIAALLNDRSLKAAAQIAANFTAGCIRSTMENCTEERCGVSFESQIPNLIKYLVL